MALQVRPVPQGRLTENPHDDLIYATPGSRRNVPGLYKTPLQEQMRQT